MKYIMQEKVFLEVALILAFLEGAAGNETIFLTSLAIVR